MTARASAIGELYDRTGDDQLLAEFVQASRDALAAIPEVLEIVPEPAGRSPL